SPLFFSSRRRHTRFKCDWSSDVCSSDLDINQLARNPAVVGTGISSALPRADAGFVLQLSWTSTDEPNQGLTALTNGPAGVGAGRSEERRVGRDRRSGGWP